VLFLLFFPPLLYRGSLQISLRDFRVSLRPIGFLSIVMVMASTVAVAVVVQKFVPDSPGLRALRLARSSRRPTRWRRSR
jgi:CPA1 family monovalent cation:H+ antiporter